MREFFKLSILLYLDGLKIYHCITCQDDIVQFKKYLDKLSQHCNVNKLYLNYKLAASISISEFL